jgi:cell division protease FtsH
VNAIIKSAHDTAREILSANMEQMHKLAAFLLEKETITGEEFMQILDAE